MYGVRLILKLTIEKKCTPGCLPFICGDRQFPRVKTAEHAVICIVLLRAPLSHQTLFKYKPIGFEIGDNGMLEIGNVEMLMIGIPIEHAVWIGDRCAAA